MVKPTKIRVSDACECAFHGFALDAQDNGAGLWDGEQDAEATRAVLKWAGWLGEDGEVLEGVQFPDHLLVPADASAEMIERVAYLVREEADAEGEYAEERKGDERQYARRASNALHSLEGALFRLVAKRNKEAHKKAEKKRMAKAVRVDWKHYTGNTLTHFVVGWRECVCGAKVADLVMSAADIYATLRCARTGGVVGFISYEGENYGKVIGAKSCDADPDAEWVELLEGVTP